MVEKSVVKEIESEIKKACKFGHFISYSRMKERHGVEILLPSTIDSTRAVTISKYFREKYGVESCFFIKRHAINVYYEE
jgi:hypothetical protein